MTWFGQDLAPLDSEFKRMIPPPWLTVAFSVQAWTIGSYLVHAKPGYAVKEKAAIGMQVNRLDKPDANHFWAIVGSMPTSLLEPLLTTPNLLEYVFSVRRWGSAGRAHWEIGRVPVGG